MANPSLLFWNGLVPSSKSESIEKPLKAEVRDPLWLLCRQWQFGEFLSEDAAMPTFAQIKYQESKPVFPKQLGEDFNTQPINIPVEASPFVLDVTIRIEIGQHWIKLLKRYLKSEKELIIKAFKNKESLFFDVIEGETKNQKFKNAAFLSNEPLINILTTARNKQVIDGEKLLNLIITKPSLSQAILGTNTPNTEVDKLGQRLLAWVKKVYNLQLKENEAWNTARMEHQFELITNIEEGKQHALVAEEYLGRDMDWYHFDVKKKAKLVQEMPAPVSKLVENIPTQVNYIGMPKTRWWEMEESIVNYGNIKTTKDNPTRLLFAQFNLVYGNDWFILPLAVETGTLTNVEEIIVTDNFGFRTKIKPTPKAKEGLWNFFNFENVDKSVIDKNWFYFPNTNSVTLNGEPIESVHFLRDEMANIVWAIEDKIPDFLGKGVSGREVANTIQHYLLNLAESTQANKLGNVAEVQYQIAASIPENWIPFIPIPIKEESNPTRQIRLQRAAMPRIVEGYKTVRVPPKTALLYKGLESKEKKPLFIYEEEIPRAGIIVNGRWKRTRWLNGKTIVWFAREKTIGKGEGNSQLKFDYLIPKKAQSTVNTLKRSPQLVIRFKERFPKLFDILTSSNTEGEKARMGIFKLTEEDFLIESDLLQLERVDLSIEASNQNLVFAVGLNRSGKPYPHDNRMIRDNTISSDEGENQARWNSLFKQSPIGEWTLTFPNYEESRIWFGEQNIQDIVLSLTYGRRLVAKSPELKISLKERFPALLQKLIAIDIEGTNARMGSFQLVEEDFQIASEKVEIQEITLSIESPYQGFDAAFSLNREGKAYPYNSRPIKNNFFSSEEGNHKENWTVLANASPIGEWTIAFSNSASAKLGIGNAKIQDIIITFTYGNK